MGGVVKITRVSPTETLRTETQATPSTLKITCRSMGGASQRHSFSFLIGSSDCGDECPCVHQSPTQGPVDAMATEPQRAKLGPTNHLRLLFILIPTISLLLFVLILTGRTARRRTDGQTA